MDGFIRLRNCVRVRYASDGCSASVPATVATCNCRHALKAQVKRAESGFACRAPFLVSGAVTISTGRSANHRVTADFAGVILDRTDVLCCHNQSLLIAHRDSG